MTETEIIAWALAHAVATLDGPDDAELSDLLHKYGGELGIEVPLGDEYQRAVLHHFDPDRVPDFPLAVTGQWRPAVNGSGKHPWFLYRDAPASEDRYHESAAGFLIRYKSLDSAQRAADRLNTVPSP